MVIRQSPRNLPGIDVLLIPRILIVVYLVGGVILLALTMGTSAEIGAQRGHLPWPIAQWAFTTPLGALAMTVVGSLIWGLPLSLVALKLPFFVRPVDVTGLPEFAWPRPLPYWRAPDGSGTLAGAWLGRGWPQRAWSLLALAFAALLLIGLFAAFIASGWYKFTHYPDCSASGCPPNFISQFSIAPEFIGLFGMNLSQFARIAYVERRCGVWFRLPANLMGRLGAYYIRRPGATPETAAGALQRYTQRTMPPIAQVIFVGALALTPGLLMMSGGVLLSTWLSYQWIPA